MVVTASPSSQLNLPPALAALDSYPWLRAPLKTSLTQQADRVLERMATFTGRRATLAELNAALHSLSSGMIALEGPAGSGVTALLAHMAATQPYAFWFSNDDGRQGASALYAQIIALQRHIGTHFNVPPLVAPSTPTDPTALERLLDEVSALRPADTPLVLLIDPPTCDTQPRDPFPMPFPARLPPHVLVVYGCTPAAALPFRPDVRIKLPRDGSEVRHDQELVLRARGCPDAWIAPIIAAAQGNFLYARIAYELLRREKLAVYALKPGLEALYKAWWSGLDAHGRHLALLLASAGEPLPGSICAELLGNDPQPLLADWEKWLVTSDTGSPAIQRYQFYHWTTQNYLARRHSKALKQVHADVVALSLRTMATRQRNSTSSHHPLASAYLLRQFARHAALGTRHTQKVALPLVARREWIRAQERISGVLVDAARDLAWELHSAAKSGPILRLTRSAALAGTLASHARMLSPDAAIAALSTAMEQGGRESGLKRVLALVDQLPDVQAKAQVLRQLGEACYAARLRTSAMRLLSQALDLEEQKSPRAWREQREQLHAALADAALNLGAIEAALEISARIGHAERRGMAETQGVRWLIEHGNLPHAREVARSITHESMGAWAQAEVAVALARTGDLTAAEALLSGVTVETASAWAQIELACDEAAHDEDAACARIERLDSPHQRDRGLKHLAHALALADKDGDALDVAGRIQHTDTRVGALLDLRLTLEGLVAMLALEQATTAIDSLTDNARVPLIAALAAAHAALGRHDRAIGIAYQLAEGEGRDRALSRVAVALAGWGDYDQGQAIAHQITDDDERDWTLDELTRILSNAGRWQEAWELGQKICADELRARTLAELAIARARASDPRAALQIAQGITHTSERSRALTIIAPLLVAQDHVAEALAVSGEWKREEGVWRERSTGYAQLPTVDTRSRYLAAVAIALTDCGHLAQAQAITASIPRPLDRARAYLAIARVAAPHDQARATNALGIALGAAIIGRDEAFRLLEQAAPVLALLGGAPLLTGVAAAVDEIDSW